MVASSRNRSPFVRLLILSVLAGAAATGIARPDGCTGSDCTGDQSTGISVTAPPNTLNIFNLSGPIQPASGTPGIRLQSSSGSDLTVNSGTAQANVGIVTNQAPGIFVSSQGTPPAPQIDPFLNIPIPGTAGVSGGVVQVNSYSDITTNGANAHAIAVQSRTTGYPDSVLSALQSFTTNGISFTVTSVANPDGSPGGVGNSIVGTLLYDVSAPPCDITDPNCKVDPSAVTPIVGKTGGTFTLNNDGTFTFVPGTAFNDLAVGASRATAVQYVLDGTRDGVNQPDVQGTLIATVTNTGNGLAVTYEVNFPQYSGYTSIQAGAVALPDLQSYVNGLIDIANGAGGAGNSVTVNSLAGTLKTTGAASYGVFAESTGAAGTNGKNGGGFFSFGTKEPTAGGDGNVGGTVTVTANGTVITQGQNSIGVFAHSAGGTGGKGGNGGTYYYGRLGGTGGDGATVSVFGNSTISTLGDYASGIYALSEGGNGGNGGSGADVTGGGDGGAGGKGGTVDVEGNWNITTQGNYAYGIWAKSVGGNAGSGGNGGWIGGHAGNGGQATDGGAVTLISGGTIATAGSGAYGLFAQSVGGFGGSGGAGGSIFYSRGGSGESAGSGGDVSLTNQASGTVITHGDGSHAIYAQSVGGGGGAGGGASAIVGVGGAGGAGGNGGTVAVTNAGLIQTYGGDARGIYAQSIGGGGGDGGNSSGLASIGGTGSSTSNGGDVTVTNSGAIQTQGVGSNAMFAQSIGGGGGSGGSSAGWFSIGGSGGGGGDAGRVAVNNSGSSLETVGSNASAIFAQSVGGGGGNGGNSTAVGAFGSLSIGGRGAAGGVGADVVINSSAGNIQTSGDRSDGVFAQSIGGGGGDGGFSVSASAGVGGSLSIGVGGAAGGGGDAGAVTVTNASRIVTAGDEAKGMFIESIGGGGGNGGFAISGAASDGLAVSFAIGGGGGNGGDGNAVGVSNSGFIGTSGNRSVGLQAQSVGGGGGDGGFSITGSGAGMGAFSLGIGGSGGSGGSASSVSVNNEGQIETLGSDALGLLVQSVGGGGGNGGFTIAAAGAGGGAGSIGIGGAGGLGGNGNSVTVNNAGAIDTSGDRATGLFAQSVGGGGGNGGFAITGAGAGAGAGTIGVGGSGAGGGAASSVTVSNTGNVHTRGEDAFGLLVQSVGGGGGNGGFSIAGSGAGIGAGSLGIGGAAAGGGDGSVVELTNKGMIETDGSRSVALFAQSVGGGGGNGGFSITGAGAGTGAGTFSLGGLGGDGGAGGAVDVSSQTSIVTLGVEATGIVAQSVGGGGGNGGFSIAGSGAGTGAGTVGIGGFAGGGGNGATVTVKSCVLNGSDCDRSAGSGQPMIETSGDRANGILAQSLGGGGGNGGFSIAGTGAGTGAGTFNLGGAGGGGGSGDAVTVESITNIATHGNEAAAIFAQSVGGGGGNGGFSITGSGAGTGAGTLGIGGFGGDGGNGKSVTVSAVAGALETFGSDSTGILAQSLGGGGGNGNFSIAGTGAGTGAGTLNIGGFAGGGGQGDTVSVTSGADVTTHGDEAEGILAQSVGGGGGNGGFSIAGAGAGTGAGTLSIGGSGGSGGNGSDVSVATTGGTIQTLGEHSTAIVAQSLGGGGGNGGFSFSGSFAEKATQFNVAVGGHGGAGGEGRNVDVSNSAVIDTEGEGSHGIFAQSVGGGGGTGGSSASFGLSVGDTKFNLSAAFGGAGGSGNVGGAVTVVNEQSITTVGNDSNGVVAQSLGGGGGAGGSSLAIDIGVVTSEKPSTSLSVDLAVGGQGGSGNHGGNASVTNFARLDTNGDGSNGIFAQSVGGGGGAGGTSRTLQLGFEQANPQEQTPSADFALKLSVGGNGGNASNGGLVSVENAGDIATRGADSSGIFAQSIGGGGGSGGEGLLGVNPLVNALVQVKELKEFFDPTKISISVGGSGGSSGDGGTVTVGNKGNIATLGLQSYGIFAQSVGGGGGLSTLYGTAEEKDGAGEEEGPAAGGKAEVGIAGKIGIGGGGGAAGNGGTVSVDHQGSIDTSGDDAHAIFAQSVGGGGGVAGSVERGLPKLSESQPSLDVGLGLAFGQAGGGGGDGGAVTVTSRGDIITRGAGANGILAQSIGGGGGLAGELGLGPQNLLPIEFAGSVGGAGSGGHVSVNHSGGIATLGNQANGIFAQSAGGQGTGGPVDVTIGGDVIAQGEGSHGIFAQSRGDAGAGNITITVTGGTVQGGRGFIQEISDSGGMRPVAASGVRFEDGANNSLINHGSVTTAAGVAGMAVSGTGGNEAIDNFGTVTGSVDLGAGANSFHNEPAATLNSGTTLQLGTGNLLINEGTFSPGGSGTVVTTALGGNLRQGTSGTYLASLDLAANKADNIQVAGSADLAGQVAVANLNAGFVTPGSHQVAILSSPLGITDSGLSLDPPPSAVIGYRLLFPDPTEVALGYDVNFSPAGLNANQTAIANNINSIALAGSSSSMSPVLAALVAQPDVRSLADSYDRLSPEPFLTTATGTVFSNSRFSDAMHSCGVADGSDRFVREGECDWFRATGGEARQEHTDSNMGFTRRSWSLSVGGQRAIGDGSWHAGFGFSYEHSTMDVDQFANTSGDQIQIGAIAKKEYGATSLAADLSAGYGNYDTDRYVNLPGPGVTARSSQNVKFVSMHLRSAHAYEQGVSWYLKPMIDLGVTHAWFPGFDETGAGGADLNVERRDQTYSSLTPALEVGGETSLRNGRLLRPYAKLGITQFLSGTSPEITASFQGAPVGVAPFTVRGDMDKTFADVNLGLTLLNQKSEILQVGYQGNFSDHLSSNSGMVKWSLPF